MNTFILDSDIRRSAEYLDFTRLHKQAVEIKQILIALSPESTSKWRRHPATKQWCAHQDYLATYGLRCVERWQAEGFQSTLAHYFTLRTYRKLEYFPEVFDQLIPLHRAYMLSKWLSHYRPLFPSIDISLQYSTYLDPISYEPFQVINKRRIYVTSSSRAK